MNMALYTGFAFLLLLVEIHTSLVAENSLPFKGNGPLTQPFPQPVGTNPYFSPGRTPRHAGPFSERIGGPYSYSLPNAIPIPQPNGNPFPVSYPKPYPIANPKRIAGPMPAPLPYPFAEPYPKSTPQKYSNPFSGTKMGKISTTNPMSSILPVTGNLGKGWTIPDTSDFTKMLEKMEDTANQQIQSIFPQDTKGIVPVDPGLTSDLKADTEKLIEVLSKMPDAPILLTANFSNLQEVMTTDPYPILQEHIVKASDLIKSPEVLIEVMLQPLNDSGLTDKVLNVMKNITINTDNITSVMDKMTDFTLNISTSIKNLTSGMTNFNIEKLPDLSKSSNPFKQMTKFMSKSVVPSMITLMTDLVKFVLSILKCLMGSSLTSISHCVMNVS